MTFFFNIAENIADHLLTNATTHFMSRCKRLCGLLGGDRRRTQACMDNAFQGRWDLVDKVAREPQQRVIQLDSAKGFVNYNLKKRP